MSVRVRYSDELYHYGVPNQKHGVRRYQNEDGSLTPLGRIHYGVGQARSAAAAGVTKVKRAASAGAEKVGTGVKNAANATGNFVKTNAPIAAKATGRAVGNAAKAAIRNEINGVKYIASGQMQRDRTRRLNERAQYRNAKAADIKSKYAKKYAKQQAKEDRYMAKMRYKEEKKKHTVVGKLKSVINGVADVSGKLAPLGTAALMFYIGGGFKGIGEATSTMATASQKMKRANSVLGSTSEARAFTKQMFKSAAKAMGGSVNQDWVNHFRSEYNQIDPNFIDEMVKKYMKSPFRR